MEKSEKRKVLVTAHRQDETEIFEKINQEIWIFTYIYAGTAYAGKCREIEKRL